MGVSFMESAIAALDRATAVDQRAREDVPARCPDAAFRVDPDRMKVGEHALPELFGAPNTGFPSPHRARAPDGVTVITTPSHAEKRLVRRRRAFLGPTAAVVLDDDGAARAAYRSVVPIRLGVHGQQASIRGR